MLWKITEPCIPFFKPVDCSVEEYIKIFKVLSSAVSSPFVVFPLTTLHVTATDIALNHLSSYPTQWNLYPLFGWHPDNKQPIKPACFVLLFVARGAIRITLVHALKLKPTGSYPARVLSFSLLSYCAILYVFCASFGHQARSSWPTGKLSFVARVSNRFKNAFTDLEMIKFVMPSLRRWFQTLKLNGTEYNAENYFLSPTTNLTVSLQK